MDVNDFVDPDFQEKDGFLNSDQVFAISSCYQMYGDALLAKLILPPRIVKSIYRQINDFPPDSIKIKEYFVHLFEVLYFLLPTIQKHNINVAKVARQGGLVLLLKLVQELDCKSAASVAKRECIENFGRDDDQRYDKVRGEP